MIQKWVGVVLAVAFVAVSFSEAGAGDKKTKLAKGSEKAVAGVQAALPLAQIEEAVEPKGFGGSGGKGTPLYWTIRYRLADKKKHEVSVTPEGTIIRLPTPMAVKDLPKAVADGLAKAAPGAKVKSVEKSEVRATLKYVALEKPRVRHYVLDVSKGGKLSRVTMTGEGTNVKVTERKPGKEAVGKNPKDLKEIMIPQKAARAVAAIKALYPDAIVEQITLEVFDGGSGVIDTLTYEIEFFTHGKKREMVASPDGIVPHLTAVIDAKTLSRSAAAALDKAIPGAKVDKAQAQEIRATLRFGPLAEARHYYTVTVEKNGKTEAIKLKPDGQPVKKAGFPGKK